MLKTMSFRIGRRGLDSGSNGEGSKALRCSGLLNQRRRCAGSVYTWERAMNEAQVSLSWTENAFVGPSAQESMEQSRLTESSVKFQKVVGGLSELLDARTR